MDLTSMRAFDGRKLFPDGNKADRPICTKPAPAAALGWAARRFWAACRRRAPQFAASPGPIRWKCSVLHSRNATFMLFCC